jgi:phosphohistidine phosphatase
LPDRDRPLADRGERDVVKMGKRLAKRDVKPELIMSSPAVRALATAEVIATSLGCKRKDIVVNDRLYAGEADDLLDVIREIGDKHQRVMLVGHNPEMTELAHDLSSEISQLPTCAVAEFTFDAKSWRLRRHEPTGYAASLASCSTRKLMNVLTRAGRFFLLG